MKSSTTQNKAMSTTTSREWVKAIQTLKDIASPIAYLRSDAEKDGAQLDGMYAQALAKDGNWLSYLAQKALVDLEEKQVPVTDHIPDTGEMISVTTDAVTFEDAIICFDYQDPNKVFTAQQVVDILSEYTSKPVELKSEGGVVKEETLPERVAYHWDTVINAWKDGYKTHLHGIDKIHSLKCFTDQLLSASKEQPQETAEEILDKYEINKKGSPYYQNTVRAMEQSAQQFKQSENNAHLFSLCLQEGKTDKGWLCLFSDEKNHDDFLKWQQLKNTSSTVLEGDWEKEAKDYYWEKTGNTFAENSRPDLLIGYIDGKKSMSFKGVQTDKCIDIVQVAKDAIVKIMAVVNDNIQNTINGVVLNEERCFSEIEPWLEQLKANNYLVSQSDDKLNELIRWIRNINHEGNLNIQQSESVETILLKATEILNKPTSPGTEKLAIDALYEISQIPEVKEMSLKSKATGLYQHIVDGVKNAIKNDKEDI